MALEPSGSSPLRRSLGATASSRAATRARRARPAAVAPRAQARGANAASQAESEEDGAAHDDRSRVSAKSVVGAVASRTRLKSERAAATGRTGLGHLRQVHDRRGEAAAATSSGQPRRSDHHSPGPAVSRARSQPVTRSPSHEASASPPMPYAATGSSRRRATNNPASTGTAIAHATAGFSAPQTLVAQMRSAPTTATASAPYSRPTRWPRAQAATPRPRAVNEAPTRAAVPRQSSASRPARPADCAPSRSTTSIPATISQKVSAAPRRSLRVSTTATNARADGDAEQHQGAAGEAEQAPRHRDEDDRGHEQAERAERQQHHRDRRGGQLPGLYRRRCGGRERGERARRSALQRRGRRAGAGAGPDSARSCSTIRSASTISRQRSEAREPVSRSPQSGQVAEVSSVARQSGHRVGSTSLLMSTIVLPGGPPTASGSRLNWW